MSEDIEFDGVDRITFGTVGPPGRRTFYLQARRGTVMVTLVVEKEHLVALGEGTEEIFKAEGYPDPATGGTDEDPPMELEEPIEPMFRVGAVALGFAEDRDLVLIECRAMAPEDEESPAARFWITKAQLEALSARGVEVASQGRPLCPLCRVPMDPEGHECFASNGHRTGSALDS
ncbi:MAG TPA: DUF3090 family protein [Actinomycetota bacterium]|nr:DUF3090 family protein [Actinomycetota bacterium]